MQLCTIATEYFALLETEVTAIHSERAVAVPIFPTAVLSEGARGSFKDDPHSLFVSGQQWR